MPSSPKNLPPRWRGRLAWSGFLLLMAALIFGPLALVVSASRAKWQREYVPLSCADRARTLEGLRLSIEAERDGIIACLRDESYCVGVYSQVSLEAKQAREARLSERYTEKCKAVPNAGAF